MAAGFFLIPKWLKVTKKLIMFFIHILYFYIFRSKRNKVSIMFASEKLFLGSCFFSCSVKHSHPKNLAGCRAHFYNIVEIYWKLQGGRLLRGHIAWDGFDSKEILTGGKIEGIIAAIDSDILTELNDYSFWKNSIFI